MLLEGLLGAFLISSQYREFFIQHSVQNGFGVISFFSARKIDDYSGNLAVGGFVEAEFIKMFGLRVDVPAQLSDKFLLSDISATVKFSPVDIILSPTLSLTFEFPTGSSPATSDMLVINPNLSIRFDVSIIKFSVFGGGNFSPRRDQASENILFPHTGNEFYLFLGGGFPIIPFLNGEVRLGAIYEDMQRFVFQPQLHLYTSISFFTGSAFFFGALGQEGNIRQGYGVGLYLSLSF